MAHLVGRKTPDDMIHAICRNFTQPGFTHEQTRTDVDKMLEGARAKWNEDGVTFDQVDQKPESKPPIKVITGTEFLARSYLPAESILGPWLRVKTLAMLYGPRGEGKTYLVLAVIVALISGGKFLDWEAPKPRKVLLIDGEMPGAALQERLRSLLKMVAGEALEYLRVITPDEQVAFTLSLNRAEDQAEIAAAIEWADVIVLDNLACLTSGDENDREAWLPVQGWILRLRAQGKTVLLVHHSGKGGDQRGTSSKEDVLDTVIKLKRPTDYEDQQGLRVEWHFVKHRSFFGKDAAPLEVKLEDASPGGGKRWKWATLEDTLLQQVVELFSDKNMTIRNAAAIMDIHYSKVHRLKKKAISMGLLKP